MIAFFTTVLDFLLLTWVFWPIILALPLVAYYNVTVAVKNGYTEVFAGLLIGAVIGILSYRFPSFRGYFDGWRAFVVVIGGYVVVGFLLSLYKWLSVLWDFRKSDVKKKVEDIKNKSNSAERKDKFTDDPSVDIFYKLNRAFDKCNVHDNEDGTYNIFPNWKKYPIGTWWVYWPFFLLELPFDFIKRIMEKLFDWLRHFYNSIAQKFSIRA